MELVPDDRRESIPEDCLNETNMFVPPSLAYKLS